MREEDPGLRRVSGGRRKKKGVQTMAQKKMTPDELREQKLQDFAEAEKLYAEAFKMLERADKLICRYVRGAQLCTAYRDAPTLGGEKRELHVYSGIMKLAKALGMKAVADTNFMGEAMKDRKALDVGGLHLFQIGHATQSRICYK